LGIFRDLIVESNLVTNKLTKLGFHLFSNTVCNRTRRKTTRLSMTNQTELTATKLSTDFWQLSGFT
jgi:hypothetical protein